jgi:hypothetical protein
VRRRQMHVRETLVRVQRFLDDNAALLGPVNSSGARKALDDAAEHLAAQAVAQGEHIIGSTGETERQRALRLALRTQCLRPIARVAAARLNEVPEFSALRLPSKDLGGSGLATAAHAMANAAAPYAQTFIDAGLKPDFLDALRDLADEIEASLGGRTRHEIARSASTIALRAETSRGRAALNLLDAAIQQHVPDDAQFLAEWSSARRIPR